MQRSKSVCLQVFSSKEIVCACEHIGDSRNMAIIVITQKQLEPHTTMIARTTTTTRIIINLKLYFFVHTFITFYMVVCCVCGCVCVCVCVFVFICCSHLRWLNYRILFKEWTIEAYFRVFAVIVFLEIFQFNYLAFKMMRFKAFPTLNSSLGKTFLKVLNLIKYGDDNDDHVERSNGKKM